MCERVRAAAGRGSLSLQPSRPGAQPAWHTAQPQAYGPQGTSVVYSQPEPTETHFTPAHTCSSKLALVMARLELMFFSPGLVD